MRATEASCLPQAKRLRLGLGEADELPYAMGLVRQAFEKQMGDGEEL